MSLVIDYKNKELLQGFIYSIKSESDLMAITELLSYLEEEKVWECKENMSFYDFEKIDYLQSCLHFIVSNLDVASNLTKNIEFKNKLKEKETQILEFLGENIVFNNELKKKINSFSKKTVGKRKQIVDSWKKFTYEENTKDEHIKSKITLLSNKFSKNIESYSRSKKNIIYINRNDLRDSILDSYVIESKKLAELTGNPDKLAFYNNSINIKYLLENIKNSNVRKRIYLKKINANRTSRHNNEKILREIVSHKNKLAILNKKKHYFNYASKDFFLNKDKDVYNFLSLMICDLYPFYELEQEKIKEFAFSTGAKSFDVWDYAFYKTSLSLLNKNESISFYTSYKDALHIISKLLIKDLGISIKPCMFDNYPTWEIIDNSKNIENKGFIIFDIKTDFERKSSNGFFCHEIKGNSVYFNKKMSNISYIIGNMTFDNSDKIDLEGIINLFHEIGHALYNYFNIQNKSYFNNTLPMDLIEVPSKLMEHYASDFKILSSFFLFKENKKEWKTCLKKWIKNHFGKKEMISNYKEVINNQEILSLFTETTKIMGIQKNNTLKNYNIFSDIFMGYGVNFDYAPMVHVYLLNGIISWNLYSEFKEGKKTLKDLFVNIIVQDDINKSKNLMEKYLDLKNTDSFSNFHTRMLHV